MDGVCRRLRFAVSDGEMRGIFSTPSLETRIGSRSTAPSFVRDGTSFPSQWSVSSTSGANFSLRLCSLFLAMTFSLPIDRARAQRAILECSLQAPPRMEAARVQTLRSLMLGPGQKQKLAGIDFLLRWCTAGSFWWRRISIKVLSLQGKRTRLKTRVQRGPAFLRTLDFPVQLDFRHRPSAAVSVSLFPPSPIQPPNLPCLPGFL
ncbi:hypothetical protein GWK47_022549 [Chionoecetes opilio]|uniref:Uncharacterized protein n=1 Tax=Chionoecetes opilio TaxID=41210 RepID=A0A8J4XMT6_CHIOP|nr:hypothetical protein GWK47_022549 [Chionoecetes opilio]